MQLEDNITPKNNKMRIIIPIVSLIVLGIVVSAILFINRPKSEEPKETGEITDISQIDYSLLDMNREFYLYKQEGYKTVYGIDLSEHNEKVDFIKLKDQGIEFVFIRVGWRGYYNPTLHIDKCFEEFYNGAKEVGIKVGIYFFSQAITAVEAEEEANFVLEHLKDKDIDFYVAYDCESIEDPIARTNDLTMDQATADARIFLSMMKEAGYEPILYTNMDWINHYYEYDILQEYPIWFAQYSKQPEYKGNHIIWQYATNSAVDGIEKGTDLNIMILKEEEAN